jgi:hypothetical protein
MKTYKRTLFELGKGMVIALFTGAAAYIITGLFTGSALFGLGIPILVTLAILYITVFSEDIYFELEPDGLFRYYKRRILQNTFDLKHCYVSYYRKSEGGFPPTHDITLTIVDAAEGGETGFDCAPLGLDQFNEMFAEMENFALKDRTVLSAGANSAPQAYFYHNYFIDGVWYGHFECGVPFGGGDPFRCRRHGYGQDASTENGGFQ